MFNAYQNRSNYSFMDPDPFCVKISEMVLKNMSILDNKIDELLACEGDMETETVDTADVIMQLVDYYQNVANTVR